MRNAKSLRPNRQPRKQAGLRVSRPAFLSQDGKVVSVVLGIKQYREMLELLEDLDDIAYLDEMSKKPVSSRPFEEFLAEHELS